LRIRFATLAALTLLTLCSQSIATPASSESDKSEEIKTSTARIDFPVGRTAGKEKCFGLEGYKSLVIIYAHYMACESQRDYVFGLRTALDEKEAGLKRYADDLKITLTSLEQERDAMVITATISAESAEKEERRKRAWRGFAIGGIIVSLALGAVITGMGVVR
jgi:hypothetical protein